MGGGEGGLAAPCVHYIKENEFATFWSQSEDHDFVGDFNFKIII